MQSIKTLIKQALWILFMNYEPVIYNLMSALVIDRTNKNKSSQEQP